MRSRTIRLGAILACAAVAPSIPAAAAAAAGELVVEPPELVSQTPAGTAGNGVSGVYGLAVSGDGGSVAFSSMATDLVADDQDPSPDIYVRRLTAATTVLASVTAAGEKGNASSTRPSLSFDGERVAFLSAASNLDATDGEQRVDAYLKELDTGDVTRVSSSSTGEPANGLTSAVALSGNGQTVAFVSSATNLDPRDTDDAPDVYVKDLATGRVKLASIAPDGNKPAAGQFGVSGISISMSGTRVAFSTDAALDPADTNNAKDIYVKDLTTGDLVLASATGDGTIGDAPSTDPALTARGNAVVFASFADNLDPADREQDSDIYRKNLTNDALSIISTNPAGEKGNDSSSTPAVSGDGRLVAFASRATNLDPKPPGQWQPDVYVKNLATGYVGNASGPAPQEPSGVVSLYPALPFDGSSVTFASNATHFTTADTNNIADVYLAPLAHLCHER
jgi:dipeptidyl aminopeptidase/acylaminoacyl peptidase